MSTNSETDPLVVGAENALEHAGNYRRPCAQAIALCGIGLLGDVVRWVLLWSLMDHWYAYSLQRQPTMVIVSVVWDVVCMLLGVALYILHKRHIPFQPSGRWSRFFNLGVATSTRLLVDIGMMVGDVPWRGFTTFILLVQLLYYAMLLYFWFPVLDTYIKGLRYQHVGVQGTTPVTQMTTPDTPPSPLPTLPPPHESISQSISQSMIQDVEQQIPVVLSSSILSSSSQLDIGKYDTPPNSPM